MLSARELGFATRDGAALPAWAADRRLRVWPLAEAKTVTLRLAEHRVLVKVREHSSLFLGEIVAFEPQATALKGMHAGDLIVFDARHIFAADA